MKTCLIVGGGLAGLSAAVHLTKKNIHVRLFEASPKLGGRAYSFIEEVTRDEVDNGQHIMLGCYENTLRLIELVNAQNNFSYQKKLEIPFQTSDRSYPLLQNANLPWPLSALTGLFKFDLLSFRDVIQIIVLVGKLPFITSSNVKNKSVREWLEQEKQTVGGITYFWELLAVGALNCNMDKAAASLFIDMLKQIFLRGEKGSVIIQPKYGLTKSLIDPLQNYLSSHNTDISLGKSVTEIVVNDKHAESCLVEGSQNESFDAILFAIPPFALSKIKNANEMITINYDAFKFAPIITTHLWLRDNPLKKKFYALTESPIQWVFNHGKHLTTVTSNAEKFIELTNQEFVELSLQEIEKYFGIGKSSFYHSRVIKEKRATFIPDAMTIAERPGIKTDIKNVFLAGDWTNTGLPATIEGAVKSGAKAAEEILSYLGC